MVSFVSSLQCGSSNHPALEADGPGTVSCSAMLLRASCSDVESEGIWLLYPLYGDVWFGQQNSFPLVSAEDGSHPRSTAVSTFFTHHPVAGKILHFAAVAFYFSLFFFFNYFNFPLYLNLAGGKVPDDELHN